ncbi:MAG TPA: iron ABC transporter permease [Anaerolineaceae bacterium]|nr:iron ABC transporter permease [Anaerolineaceae bacterium]HNZ14519.1 iron ABC transporter permease [Anaerolineaceae bacterium]HOH91749.1 iron ABC transporter permease [Anaerolineaceae bacterium]HQL92133.1 iron ABC transporter permease [Anaerolineaceae bacterium]
MKRSIWQTLLLWVLPLAFLLIFFYQPLLAIFRLVFSAQFSQGWKLFRWSQITKPLAFTLYQATLSTVLTLVLGLPAAYLFARFDFAGRKFLRVLITIPFILPTVVVTAAFNTLLGPRGWLNLGLMSLFNLSAPPIHMLNSLSAILLAHIFYNTSIVIRMVGSNLSRLRQNLPLAAQNLGASPWRAFKEVTLPLLMPAILSATLMVFLFDFTSFGVVLMLGGPQFSTLEVEIYNQAMNRFNLPVAGLLSIVQLAFTLLVSVLINRSKQPRYGKAALASESSGLREARTRWEKIFVIVMVVVLLLLMVTPTLSLLTRSFFTFDAARGERGELKTGFTLRYYRELFENREQSLFYVPPILAIRNSMIYAGITMLLATVLGLISVYAIQKSGKLSRFLEPLIMLPLGASAVTLGLGFLIVFGGTVLTQGRFQALIPVAHTLVALPMVIRTLLPALRGIPENLRLAAKSMGASPLRVFREVDLPVLFRAIAVSLLFAFTISLGEFGASSFLSNTAMPTIPVAIYRYLSQPGALNYGQALAMSSLLMVVCVAGSLIIEQIRLPGEEVF